MIDIFPDKHWWISPPLGKMSRPYFVLRYKGEEVRLKGRILKFSSEDAAERLRKRLVPYMEE